MPRKQEPVLPIYPLIHNYEASVKNVLQQASMLLQIVKMIAETPETATKLQSHLKERVNALARAMYGDEYGMVE